MAVDVVHWNPTRPRFTSPLLRRLPVNVAVNNFGDLIGPRVVDLEVRRRGIVGRGSGRLLSVGSILHLAQEGDVVWGTGVNGKLPLTRVTSQPLDVRAVRGPRTREALRTLGHDVPEVYGDPALLLPHLDPRLHQWAERPKHALTVMPNLNEVADYRHHPAFFDPTSPFDACLRRLATSRFVVASSLHAVIVAESLGIEARAVLPRHEHAFKYEDYYRGTGRDGFRPAGSVEEALRLGGEAPLDWDPSPLAEAFPIDLWGGTRDGTAQLPA